MKALAFLFALSACANAFVLRPGALQGLLAFGFGFVGALLAVFGGFAWWWDGSMQPGKRSAAVMVCGLVALGTSLWALLRAAAEDER